MSAERTCDKCGKTFTSDGAWYTKHALRCTGTPAKSGRVRSIERTAPSTKRTVPRKRASPFAAAIAELEARRAAALTEADKFSGAIAALEALA